MSQGSQAPNGPPPGYTSQHQGGGEGKHITFEKQEPHSESASATHRHMSNPFRRAHSPRQDQHRSEKPAFGSYETFAPPPGPPPSQVHSTAEEFAPPPGPPPSHSHPQATTESEPPPYDPWLSVPDNSSLPPPPSLGYEESPTANATGDQADRASAWCRSNQLWPPRRLSSVEISYVRDGIILLSGHPTMTGTISGQRGGNSHVRTRSNTQDSLLLTSLPLYSALDDNPRVTAKPKTIYFEIRVIRMGGDAHAHSSDEADAGIAVGFAAPPYPSFRLPGWERASLGVHGDDGRRYIDNNRGGLDFTTAFKSGEVVGIGVRFSPPSYGQKLNIEVFFTRNGKKDGGWDLFEERDAEEGGIDGLEGSRDLLGAIGFFGGVEFETRFRRDEWLYRP